MPKHARKNPLPPVVPRCGICRRCGCADDDACWNDLTGPCHWTDEAHTLCSECVNVPEGKRRCRLCDHLADAGAKACPRCGWNEGERHA